MTTTTPGASDSDDRLGEAIETYLALIEQGAAPEPEAFASLYPDIGDDIRSALEGLELVNGLHGPGPVHGAGSGPSGGPGRSLESGRRIAGYRVVRELGRGGMGSSMRRFTWGWTGRWPSRFWAFTRPRLVGAAPVLERGSHGRGAAPYAYRPGLRCRAGWGTLLLRHAAY